jgi:uncharacterized membrane protein
MTHLLPRLIPEQDLLKEWLKRVRLQNSDFAIGRSISVQDSELKSLHDYFVDFFGSDFFKITPRELKVATIKAKNSDWFYQLLANDDYPSLLQLFEVRHLLQFLSYHQSNLYGILKANTRSQAFRNYLFEGIIFEMLSRNKVKFDPKPQINGKEREGFLSIGQQQFLFECKKLYSYQLPGLGFIFTVHEEFFRLWRKYPLALNGFITINSTNEELLKKHRPVFNQSFKDFFQQLKKTKQIHFQKEIVDENNKLVGKIFFEPYNIAIFEHQVSLLHDTAVCFRIKPAIATTIQEELKDIHNTKLLFKFNMMESNSVAFLLNKLDKKRKSQKDMKHLPRIFFFDNEIYRGTEFGLFQSEVDLNAREIQSYVNSKSTNDIVCILFRKYVGQQRPQWKLKVFCKPGLEQYKKAIEGWDMLYQAPEFAKQLPTLL